MVNQKKVNYVNQLIRYCEEYRKILIVNADNVGSRQMQQIRVALRGKAVVAMGKNTLMKKALELHKSKNTKLQALLEHMVGNIGFVFTNGDLSEVRSVILKNRVAAPARVGAISPVTVIVPAGNTGMEPTKTSFFQALNIPTKITKAMVEIINDYVLLKPGDKVGQSEATLLQMLNIKPFSYGFKITKVYDDGELFDPEVLDISDEEMLKKFTNGVNNIASISLELGIPTEASVPHSVINAFKSLLAVAAETEVTFKEAEEVKAYLKDPSKFASAVQAAPAATESKKEEKGKKEEKKEEPPQEEEDLGFGSLF
jgi:large subunit ribosomal protein LP0